MKTRTLPPHITLAPTARDDIDALPDVERAAARRFATQPDLAWIADAPVQDRHQHRACADAGHSWVARHKAQPVGFISPNPWTERCLFWNSPYILTGREKGSVGH